MSDVYINFNLNDENAKIRAEILKTITALTLKLERTIKEDMLTGQRLNVQTGRLRGSVVSNVQDNAEGIEGIVGAGGSLVKYAFIHEFGLNTVLSIKEHTRKINKVFGKSISPLSIQIKAHTRTINFKERRFMRDSLDQVAKIVPQNLIAAINRGLENE